MDEHAGADDLSVTREGHVAVVEIHRPPHNFFDFALVRAIADAYDALDADPECRAIVLCSEGRNFCAGADLGDGSTPPGAESEDAPLERVGVTHLYEEAVRLFRARTPVVAAVQGAAVGGGLGLALSADFRVAGPGSRFVANFTRLGFHPGFGLTVTLPRVIGHQRAAWMFLTSRRIPGELAHEWGLVDVLAEDARIRDAAFELAREIATNAPLGVAATRATLRAGLAEAVRAATAHELAEQTRLRATEDFREGVAASAARRTPNFKGR